MILRYYISEAKKMAVDHFRQHHYQDVSDDVFYDLVEFDPTYEGIKHTDNEYDPSKVKTGVLYNMIFKLYRTDKNNFERRKEEIKNVMSKYLTKNVSDKLYWDMLKKQGVNINSASWMSGKVDDFIDKLTSIDLDAKEISGTENKRRMRDQDIMTIYKDSNWIVKVPLSVYAMNYLGLGTSWCVAKLEKDPNIKNANDYDKVIKHKGLLLPSEQNLFLRYVYTGSMSDGKPDAMMVIFNAKDETEKYGLCYPEDDDNPGNGTIHFYNNKNTSVDLWEWLYNNRDTITDGFKKAIHDFKWTDEMRKNAYYEYDRDIKPLVEEYYANKGDD